MLILEYFIQSMRDGLYMDRKWLIRMNGILMEADAHDELPSLVNGKVGFVKDGTVVYLTDYVKNTPIIGDSQEVKIPAGTLPNIDKDMVTTYRKCILNGILLVYPFGNKVPYHTGSFTRKWLDKLCEDLLKNDTISTEEYNKVFRAALFIDFLSDFCVPTASRKMMEPSKAAIELRDKLLAEYAGQLDDPVIIAKIDKAIGDLLLAELKDDESSGFLINPNKSVMKVRKMTHGMIGGVPRLDDPSKVSVITSSLEEGWRAEDVPALSNNLRSGSYDRGSETALGGEAAKFSGRIFQNVSTAEDDCGTKVGEPFIVSVKNLDSLVGMYTTDNNIEPLTEVKLASLMGKQIYVRLPTTCNTGGGNLCKRCLGDQIGLSNVGLGPQLSALGNVFLSISLSKFHGKVLKTKRWNWRDRIS